MDNQRGMSKNKYTEWLEDIWNRYTTDTDSKAIATDLRNFLEDFFYSLTINSKEKFPNLYSRIVFIHELHRLDNDLIANIHQVRKLLSKVDIINIFSSNPNLLKACVFYIVKVTSVFSLEIPGNLKWILQEDTLSLLKTSTIANEQIDSVTITVDDYTQPSLLDKKRTCRISGYSLEQGNYVNIELTDIAMYSDRLVDYKYGRLLGNFSKLIWKGAKITFYHLEILDFEKQRLRNTDSTKIILEPDYLVDATSIASCFQSKYACHKLAMLSLISNISISLPFVKGNFVNQILDRMIKDQERDFNKMYVECVHSSILTALSIGVKELMVIMKDIRQNHFPNMLKVTDKFEDIQLTIEPSFYAPKYGLYGRLDGLIEGENNDPKRKSIFELKSGKAPYNGVWKSHEVQVVIYNLLLESTFGQDRSGSSMIFYSCDNKAELRNVTSNTYLEQHILMLRNCIVSDSYKVANEETTITDYISSLDESKLPIYKQEEYAEIMQHFSSLTPTEKAYYTSYFAFLMREIWSSKTGYFTSNQKQYSNYGFSSIWLSSNADKSLNSKVITLLDFSNYDDDKLVFLANNNISNCSLRKGDRVVLYPASSEDSFEFKSQIIKCSIVEIAGKIVSLKPRNSLINERLFASYSFWNIEQDSNDSLQSSLLSSLTKFTKLPPSKRALLLGSIKPKTDTSFTYSESTDYLNPIITKALASRDYFLLQGPPGTGKTSSFLINCIKYLYRNTNEKIMILSFTNRAIDEVCHKLNDSDIDYLRLGSKSDSSISSIHDLTNSNQKLAEIESSIDKYQVFCSTVASYHSSQEALNSIISFDTLFIDEASQLLEADIIGILDNFQRFIMIGDQIQLPAIVTQSADNKACNLKELNALGIHDYGQSLFERLFTNAQNKNWQDSIHTLEFHYRMHSHVADLVNPFYNNQLKTGLDKQKSTSFLSKLADSSDKLLSQYLSKSRIIFINIEDKSSSKVSVSEAEIVKILVKSLITCLGSEFSDKSIGIICPWRSQINLIRSYLTDFPKANAISVDTVERFQGSERDIIIYSLACNFIHQLDNLESLSSDRNIDRKLNVALSRSIEQIILVGNARILCHLQQYDNVIKYIKEKGLYIDYKSL